jgi:hypothetical protein
MTHYYLLLCLFVVFSSFGDLGFADLRGTCRDIFLRLPATESPLKIHPSIIGDQS